MRASGYSVFRSAVFGFAITAAFVSYQLLTEPQQSTISRSSSLMLTFLLLCPPSILSITRQVEVGTQSFYILWIVIGVLNAALYAGIRTLIKRRLRKAN
jgi:Na+/citrate or Na+/malate symporter